MTATNTTASRLTLADIRIIEKHGVGMTDPINWDAGDFHRWKRPASADCPNCVCCSAALCKLAIEKDTACHFEGRSPDYDLADCPCWRRANADRLLADHGETVNPSYFDPRGLARKPQDGRTP